MYKGMHDAPRSVSFKSNLLALSALHYEKVTCSLSKLCGRLYEFSL